MKPQMLLSCSHVFHESCIKAWKKVGNKCPICRADYQWKNIKDGAEWWRNKMAETIQKCWKGYKTRKMYKQLLDHFIPSDPVLQRRFLARKVLFTLSLNSSRKDGKSFFALYFSCFRRRRFH